MKTMTTPKLQPCPFCGSEKVQVITKANNSSHVRCNECGVASGNFLMPIAASHQWNSRDASVEWTWTAYPENLGYHWAMTGVPRGLTLVYVDKNGRNLYVEFLSKDNPRIRIDEYIDIFRVRGFSPVKYPVQQKEEPNEEGGNK